MIVYEHVVLVQWMEQNLVNRAAKAQLVERILDVNFNWI